MEEIFPTVKTVC